jgi:hypothetical protein
MTLTLTEEQKTRLAARHKDVDAWLAILQDRVDIGRWTEEEFGRALVEQLAAADEVRASAGDAYKTRAAHAIDEDAREAEINAALVVKRDARKAAEEVKFNKAVDAAVAKSVAQALAG